MGNPAKTFQFVVQFDGSVSYNKLIEIEEILEYELGHDDDLDGHDMGNGQANIFIHTNEPSKLFLQISKVFNTEELSHSKMAFRKFGSEMFEVLWPIGESNFEMT